VKKILIIVLAVFVLLLFFFTNEQISISDDDKDGVLSDKKELVNKPNKLDLIENDDKNKFQNNEKLLNTTSSTLEPKIQQALEKLLNTSSVGLIENETDDGYSVELQGRFRSVPVATIKEDGEILIKDYTSFPKQSNK